MSQTLLRSRSIAYSRVLPLALIEEAVFGVGSRNAIQK